MYSTKHALGSHKHRIRVLTLSAMVLLMLSTACNEGEKTDEPSSPNRGAEKFSYSITVNKSVYSQDEPITVTVALLVLDEGEASIVYENAPNPIYTYKIALVDQHGQNVPFTNKGRQLSLTMHGHIEWVLNKDAPWHDRFRLDDLFDLSEPSMYTLTLKQKVWTSLSTSHELTGDPVTFSRLP